MVDRVMFVASAITVFAQKLYRQPKQNQIVQWL